MGKYLSFSQIHAQLMTMISKLIKVSLLDAQEFAFFQPVTKAWSLRWHFRFSKNDRDNVYGIWECKVLSIFMYINMLKSKKHSWEKEDNAWETNTDMNKGKKSLIDVNMTLSNPLYLRRVRSNNLFYCLLHSFCWVWCQFVCNYTDNRLSCSKWNWIFLKHIFPDSL